MKPKLILSLAIAFSLLLFIPGCYKDVISPGSDPNGPPQFVSFSGDLIPIFNRDCNSSGCHDAVPAHKPSLVPDKAYTSLMSGGYVNTSVPNQSKIYTVLQTGAMPPTGALNAKEQQLVLDWIRNGAPNN